MYICPTCGKGYKTEEAVAKCMLACWRKANPNHKPKPVHQSEDVYTREVNQDIVDFFSSLQKERV